MIKYLLILTCSLSCLDPEVFQVGTCLEKDNNFYQIIKNKNQYELKNLESNSLFVQNFNQVAQEYKSLDCKSDKLIGNLKKRKEDKERKEYESSLSMQFKTHIKNEKLVKLYKVICKGKKSEQSLFVAYFENNEEANPYLVRVYTEDEKMWDSQKRYKMDLVEFINQQDCYNAPHADEALNDEFRDYYSHEEVSSFKD